MKGETFSFSVGGFQCIAVKDGTHCYEHPASLLFPGVPRDRLEGVLREHDVELEKWEEWVSPYTCLVVKTGQHLVLVDTGAGKGLGPTTGRLLGNLEGLGISPGDIDTVILTHGHPDHIGGNTVEGSLAFPGARFVMFKEEWDFWTSAQAGLKLTEMGVPGDFREVLLGFAEKNLPPISDQVDFVEREAQIVPGIQAVAAPGHTPGQMMPVIESGGERLLYVSDAVIHPVHLEQPEWPAAVDASSGESVATRRRILEMAGNEKTLILGFHFPFPGLGRIVRKGEGWKWQPIT